jgi:hypothetical protein
MKKIPQALNLRDFSLQIAGKDNRLHHTGMLHLRESTIPYSLLYNKTIALPL